MISLLAKWFIPNRENTADAAVLIEQYGIVKAPVAQKALPFCNLRYIDGADLQTALTGFLGVLFEQNPKAVGGKLPDAGFFYGV